MPLASSAVRRCLVARSSLLHVQPPLLSATRRSLATSAASPPILPGITKACFLVSIPRLPV
ncbi:hypothetical protein HK405_015091 [Cladochytrium tenue]|nr:hypothetical protein HK405_015091 [Cladochytrium tenue]